MNDSTSTVNAPALFVHTTRKEWGVGVLAWDAGGKRGYLFHDGMERILATGFFELMAEVEHPSPDQTATSVRLHNVLAGRAKSAAHRTITDSNGPTFDGQVTLLRKLYPAGLADLRWSEEVRGEGANPRSLRKRTALITEAAELLGAKVLDALLASRNYTQVWESVVKVLGNSDLVSKAQLAQPKNLRAEQQQELALALRDMLHGKGAYAPLFARFLAALSHATGKVPGWETSTAISAIVHPAEHVCVHSTAFRLQFKILGIPGSVPAAKPTAAAYARVLAATRAVAEKLSEHGETPRDLLDVHDFIRITTKVAPKARGVRAGSPARTKSAPPGDTDSLF